MFITKDDCPWIDLRPHLQDTHEFWPTVLLFCTVDVLFLVQWHPRLLEMPDSQSWTSKKRKNWPTNIRTRTKLHGAVYSMIWGVQRANRPFGWYPTPNCLMSISVPASSAATIRVANSWLILCNLRSPGIIAGQSIPLIMDKHRGSMNLSKPTKVGLVIWVKNCNILGKLYISLTRNKAHNLPLAGQRTWNKAILG